ncbi:MAG TPA: hypothetical protein VFD41_06345 [Actinomycetales bacterium]|nr:hypothetical protein [Actinomycetales bacterium]
MATTTTTDPVVDSALGTTHRSLVAGGLAVGALLGFSGNFFDPGSVQDLLYAVSSTGLIVASALLAVAMVRAGSVFAGAGFVLLALGESRLMNPTDAPGGEASFAAGVLLCAAALLLIGLSTWAPRWVRIVGWMAAVPFAAHSLAFLGGADVDSTGALAGIGYALFTLTIVGWVLTVVRPKLRA